ncbi:hypothetical protein ACFO4E_26050 [Nocardiopsis mangrovi]|uniref:UDP-N-acetylmuramyl pentapeptide phosphotransferase/UDP-N-acetylglucosamine-1-phosphate transferase n=1 Tax=Nocardiopsis mangrovi TaxID=1179818 RepID=A0ABV9E6S0_9ACTN
MPIACLTAAARCVRSVCAGTAAAAFGACGARAAYTLLAGHPGQGTVDDVFRVAEHARDVWTRTNFRGADVTLVEGPALAAGICAGTALAPGVPRPWRAAAVVAAAGSAVFGAYDDISGSSRSRGFRGHLGALARGEVTTGAIKIAGIGATGLAAAAVARGRPIDVLINGAVIAGSANLLNLFDLRPGRAIKVGLAAGAPALTGPAAGIAGAALGAAAAVLPEDLAERAMLGDAGANALGAALGVAAAVSLPRRTRAALLGGVVGLTLASEFVSFSRIITEVPPLRRLDGLGRRTPPAPGPVPVGEPLTARSAGPAPVPAAACA